MSRNLRQSKILNIISSADVETQEELAVALRESGFDVTQATISRDIKELGLVKTLAQSGKYKYVSGNGFDSQPSKKLINVVRDAVLSVNVAENLVVISTVEAGGSSVAGVIEQFGWTEIVGVLADRHTVLVVCASNADAQQVCGKITREL